MAQQSEPSSFIQSLSKPKGVLLAAPVIIGAALLFNVVVGGDRQLRAMAEDAPKSNLRAEPAGPDPKRSRGCTGC